MNKLRFASKILAPAAFLALAVAGCASGEPPTAELSAARTAIADAESAGAAQRANYELSNARSKLQSAENASREEEYEDARWLAEQAAADARVASAKSRSVAATAALSTVEKNLDDLRREAGRSMQR